MIKNVTNETIETVRESDSQIDNYAVSTPSNGKYGDAVYETSSSGSNSTSWYSDYSYFMYFTYPFLGHGGLYNYNSYAGIFYFSPTDGYTRKDDSFRVVLPVL